MSLRKMFVNQAMPSELFPPSFPSELAVAAFPKGEEAAWRPRIAAAAVEWFGAHGYAVLGTELWLLKGTTINTLPIGRSGMRHVHANTVNRDSEEAWNSFVARAATDTLAYLQAFNPAYIVEEGEVYFNVVWVSEADYKTLKAA